VLLAYDRLLAEGFAVGRGGSGTYVSSGLGRAAPTHAADIGHIEPERVAADSDLYGPVLSYPSTGRFSRKGVLLRRDIDENAYR